MKKILTLCAALMVVFGMYASDYKHSVGVVAGLGLGAQYKVMFTEHFTLMEEFGYFTCPDGGTGAYGGAIDNVVLAYQAHAVEGKGIQLDWYAGGQLKIGYAMMGVDAGVFGVGGAGGIEANMKNAPIAFSFDFRPGFGMVFDGGKFLGVNPMFDWSFNLGVRYTFPK